MIIKPIILWLDKVKKCRIKTIRQSTVALFFYHTMNSIWIVTEVTNGKITLIQPFTQEHSAKQFIAELLESFRNYCKDCDHENIWHCIFETGQSTIVLKECEIDDFSPNYF